MPGYGYGFDYEYARIKKKNRPNILSVPFMAGDPIYQDSIPRIISPVNRSGFCSFWNGCMPVNLIASMFPIDYQRYRVPLETSEVTISIPEGRYWIDLNDNLLLGPKSSILTLKPENSTSRLVEVLNRDVKVTISKPTFLYNNEDNRIYQNSQPKFLEKAEKKGYKLELPVVTVERQ